MSKPRKWRILRQKRENTRSSLGGTAMICRRNGVRVGSARSTLCGVIALTGLACFASLTSAAATPITYVLSPPISDSAHTILVTGDFTFDASGPTLDAVDLVATGGPQPGSYTVPVTATASQIEAEIPSTDSRILVGFAADLGDGPVMVSFVAFPPAADDPLPVTGTAVPQGIPEPSSIALLGGILGLFLAASRANASQARSPDFPSRVAGNMCPGGRTQSKKAEGRDSG